MKEIARRIGDMARTYKYLKSYQRYLREVEKMKARGIDVREQMSYQRYEAMYNDIKRRNEIAREEDPDVPEIKNIPREMIQRAAYTTGRQTDAFYRGFREHIGRMSQEERREFFANNPELASLEDAISSSGIRSKAAFSQLIRSSERNKEALFNAMPKEESESAFGKTVFRATWVNSP